MMDTPSIILVALCLVPLHIFIACAGTTREGAGAFGGTLVGYSQPVAVIQFAMLVLLLIVICQVQSPLYSGWKKFCFALIGYPVITFSTNIVPGLIQYVLGG